MNVDNTPPPCFYSNKEHERWCATCNKRVAKSYMSEEMRRIMETDHLEKYHSYINLEKRN